MDKTYFPKSSKKNDHCAAKYKENKCKYPLSETDKEALTNVLSSADLKPVSELLIKIKAVSVFKMLHTFKHKKLNAELFLAGIAMVHMFPERLHGFIVQGLV